MFGSVIAFQGLNDLFVGLRPYADLNAERTPISVSIGSHRYGGAEEALPQRELFLRADGSEVDRTC